MRKKYLIANGEYKNYLSVYGEYEDFRQDVKNRRGENAQRN
jgi:hypothetical protein